MPKQINVKLGVQADTSQAKKQLEDLQNQLTKLATQPMGDGKLGLSKEIADATTAAARLKVELKEATNVNTGQLDLSKFQQNLSRSNMDLSKYKQQLEALGPEGSKAFNQLGNAILASEIPLRRTSQLLDQFSTALQNTIRWQFSSSALHGFMSAIQGAYGYAQDLNASLNSIRIVSGQSAEQMARFAEQANRSAQALSTSTLAYTDASLIFYQQGLRGSEVTERVDTVLKLSNVTGDSAEQISSYMTAIWNNFADGSQSLESFADKITALGAATASSSAEIAAGLQQFAAVGNTIGLSYDYAATALATIIAQTRQSESTVGNSLRTIFSRLSSLKQGGEEDGVDLTKYTKALQEVGVNVLDQNGELKEMDEILDDIGSKWDSLNRSQQIALAQTVGGVRQYTNLIALFDNWDKFQENLEVTQNASGTLQEQADIYAESWEAARKRVLAAWQAIYQELIDDKFFITMLNGLESVLHGVNNLIKAFGGLPGVLSTVAALMTQIMGPQLKEGVSNLLYNLTPLSVRQGEEKEFKQKTLNLMYGPEEKSGDLTETAGKQREIQEANLQIQQDILNKSNNLSKTDKEILNLLINQRQELENIAKERAKAAENAKREEEQSALNLTLRARRNANKEGTDFNRQGFSTALEALEEKARAAYRITDQESDEAVQANMALEESVIELEKNYGDLGAALDAHLDKVRKTENATKDLKQADDNLKNSANSINSVLNGTMAIAPSVADSIVHIAQSATALLSAINAVKGLWSTLQNPDLSWAEKLAAVMTTITTVSMLLARAKMAETGKSIVNTAVTVAETLAKIANAKATKEQSKASKAYQKDKVMEAITNAKGAEGFTALKFAGEALGPVLSFLGAHLIPIAIGVAAVGAAIYLLDKKIYTAKEQLADANKELERANKDLDIATESANKTAEAYKSLKDTLDKLGEKEEAINKLTRGTIEWKEAIAESNSELLDALKAAGQLGKVTVRYDDKGLAYLDESDRQKALENSYQNVSDQNIRKMWAETDVSNAQLNKDLAELVQELSQKGYDIGTDASNTKAMLENLGSQLAEIGMAGLTGDQLLQAIENGDPRLDFLRELPDLANNADVLDAIAQAAEKVSISFNEVNAYQTEMGRQLLEASGIDVPDWASAEMAKAIGDALYEGFSDLEVKQRIRDLTDEDKALYAANTAGVNWNATTKKFTDDSGTEIKVENESIARLMMLIDRINNFDINSEENQQALSQARYAARDQLANDTLANSNIVNSQRNGAQQLKEFEDWFNSLDDEGLSLLAKIHIDKEDTLEDIQAKMDELEHEITFEVDADVDPEELESLKNYIYENATAIDDLDNHLAECESEANKIAHAILRFDDAIQDVSENYDTWMAQLSSGAFQDVAANIDDIKDAYGDLLDIDPSTLTDGFLRSTDNMKDMKAAIEGSEEAYNRLQAAAGQSILIKAGVALDDQEALAKFQEDLNFIKGFDFANYGDWATIQAGANLDDSAFIEGLNRMLENTNMTVEQAEAYLASLGIDAEVEQVPAQTTTVQSDRQYWEPATYHTETEETGGEENPGVYKKLVRDEPGRWVSVPESHDEQSAPSAYTLKVKTAHKSAGGNLKYNNASHGAGSKGAGAPSKGKSGGGGGSGAKKKTVKEHKKPEEKTDRYHDIKERIADLNTELKRLEKTENRVYGKAKLKYMDQEIEKLEKQIELTDEYIDEIKKYAAQDQAKLRGIGMGATFDDTGRLNNYEQVLANIVASYNQAVATYNGAVDTFNASAQEDADNARLEAADKALAAAKETYDERLKILDQYEDTFNLLQEKWDERIDQVWQLFDKRLEQITWRIEFELDWNEKELTQFDWLLKYIGKDADHAADAIANLAKQMGVYEESLNWAKEGISEIFGLHGINFDFDNTDPQQLYDQLAQFMQMQNLESQLTEGEADALLQYMEAMRDAYDGMYDSWIEAHDRMMNAFDEWNDRLQEGLNDIAQYGQELEGIQKIVELTGRKMLKMTTQDMNRMSQAIVTNAQEYLRAATARRDALEPEVLAAEAHLQELIAGGASEEAINLARDEYRHMMEAWNEATNDWYSAFADALQAGQEAFETFIEQSTQDYKEGFGSMDLDYMQEQFERQKKVRDLYLDDYQKYHELNNTAKELNKSLANTNSELIRGKMLDLQDEMNAAMQNGVQISEAQAEIYARRVALLQAEAELLDAQNAKNAVRMTRDNEGNFSYTYTADQEQIGEAQNNYGDKFYELLQYERDYADQIQSEMLDSFQEFIDRRNEIAETYKDDQDAYVQAMEDLNEEYLAYVDYYVGELDMDFYEMGRLRDDDWLDFENITGLKLAEHDDFISHFTDTILGDLTNDYTTAGALATQWQHLMEESCQAATTAVNTYQSNTETTYNKAGENIETYGLKVNTKFDEMANKSADTADAVEDMGQDMVNTMAEIQSEAYQLDNTWAYVMDSMRNQIANTINALYSLMQKLDETTEHAKATIAAVQAAAAIAAANGYPPNYGGDYSNQGSPSGGKNPGGKQKPDTTTTTTTTNSNSYTGPTAHVAVPGGHGVHVEIPMVGVTVPTGGSNFSHGSGGSFGSVTDWLRDIFSGATGGYTGSWGPEGRLAMLHEKELVLNKEDTANMLTAVNVVRGMMDSIAGNGMMNSLALAAGGVSGSFGNMLDQNVHIEANFPNVQSHTEIEMAINNLINSASQYVNRKS